MNVYRVEYKLTGHLGFLCMRRSDREKFRRKAEELLKQAISEIQDPELVNRSLVLTVYQGSNDVADRA